MVFFRCLAGAWLALARAVAHWLGEAAAIEHEKREHTKRQSARAETAVFACGTARKINW
jgi:hypothetical protein